MPVEVRYTHQSHFPAYSHHKDVPPLKVSLLPAVLRQKLMTGDMRKVTRGRRVKTAQCAG